LKGVVVTQLLKKISPLILLLISSHSFSADSLETLQQACKTRQLQDHKGIKGQTFSEDDFGAYCKCEADFILDNATEDQLNLINKNPSAHPKWLKQLKIKALNSCVKQDPPKTT
jgi:hypothetical protein